jgi:hypothetical protein
VRIVSTGRGRISQNTTRPIRRGNVPHRRCSLSRSTHQRWSVASAGERPYFRGRGSSGALVRIQSGRDRDGRVAARTSRLGKRLEGRIPDDFAVVSARGADRAWPVVEMLARVAAEMRERRFVGIEELGKPLVGAGPVEAAAAATWLAHRALYRPPPAVWLQAARLPVVAECPAIPGCVSCLAAPLFPLRQPTLRRRLPKSPPARLAAA